MTEHQCVPDSKALVVIGEYRKFYLHRRPHSSLSYRTPAPFAAECTAGNPKVSAAVSEPNAGNGLLERETGPRSRSRPYPLPPPL